MARSLSVRITDDIYHQLDVFARANDLTMSQAAREVLSRSLIDADDVTRGYKEGVMQGKADVFAAVQASIDQLR